METSYLESFFNTVTEKSRIQPNIFTKKEWNHGFIFPWLFKKVKTK